MTNINRPLKVFLCHTFVDKPVVHRFYKRLLDDGVDVWLDAESLIPGQTWRNEIDHAIQESDVIIVFLSENSINKEGYVQKEIRLALEKAQEKPDGTIFVIPARITDCKVPKSLEIYQWVDLFESRGYEKLTRSLQKRAEDVKVKLNYKKRGFWAQRNLIFYLSLLGGIFVFLAIAANYYLRIRSTVISETPSALATLRFPSSAPETRSFSNMSPTSEVFLTSTPTPLLSEFVDASGAEMALVPSGEFIMGSDRYPDSQPVHTVYLDDFYIDKYEVTNQIYETCVLARACVPPVDDSSYSRREYYGNPIYKNHPVIYINWEMAKNFCEWRGSRLPTEAEWEKAARGLDGRTYPWGENIDCTYGNYFGCTNDTTPVGEYPKGVSVYGVYDMVGNVAEWVSDWYYDKYYEISPNKNPVGPDTGEYHILRGSSYPTYQLTVNQHLAYRNQYLGWNDAPGAYKGFRCARAP